MSGGKDGEDVLVGHKIYLGMHMILCQGPIDYITRVRADKKSLITGEHVDQQVYINQPNVFGGYKQEGGVVGYFDFEFGAPDQIPNDYLQSKLGTNISAHRGVVGVVARRPYLTSIPYVKEFDFRVQRIYTRQDGAEQWYPGTAGITNDLCKENFALFISFDSSDSMAEVIAPATESKFVLMKRALVDFLDWVDGRLSFNSFDIALCSWNGDTPPQTVTYRNVTSSSIASMQSWVNSRVLDTYTVFEDGVTDAPAFFSASPSTYKRHLMFFSDGEPWTVAGPNPNEATAIAAGNIVSGISNLKASAFTINEAVTDYSEYIDNTPDDGVPILTGSSSDELTAYMRNAMGPWKDQNPAHIIYECLTNQDWGMGYPETDIDDTAFRAAADALFEESFGLSFLWDKQQPLNEFITSVLQHMDAALYVSKSTGKFVLKLIRDDYAISNLTILDETNIEDVDDVSRTSFGELVNSVSVVFYNLCISKFDSVNAQDSALVQQQNAVVETTFQYPGITNTFLAARVAERELRGLSQELLSCTVYANREAASLNIGDTFILDWPDYQIDSVVMRVQEVAYGDGRSNRIKIKCAQDVFATDAEPYIAETPEQTEGPREPEAPYPRIVFEAPYYVIVRALGDSITEDLFADNPNFGYPMALGGKPFSSALSIDMQVDDGAGYVLRNTGQFSPMGLIYASSDTHELDKTSTFMVLEDVHDLEFVTAPTYCLIGDEIISVESINQNSDGLYEVVIGRGCMDTVPDEHTSDSVGAYVLFWKNFYCRSQTQYTDGELLDIKLLTNTWSGKLDIDSAVPDSLLMRSRALLPYPPGDFRINGESYPDSLDTERNSNTDSNGDYFTFTWAHRDRLQQTGATLVDHTYGDIGPEAGTTYNIRIYDITNGANELLESQTGISGTSHNWYLIEDSNERNFFRVELESVRDTLVSWQTIKHEFYAMPYSLEAPRLMEDGSLRLREDGTPRLKEVE